MRYCHLHDGLYDGRVRLAGAADCRANLFKVALSDGAGVQRDQRLRWLVAQVGVVVHLPTWNEQRLARTAGNAEHDQP